MTAKILKNAICVMTALILALASPAFADMAADVARAENLMGQGRVEEAYGIYRSLLREYPDDDEVNLGLARAAMASNRPHQAIMAYERLIAKYPGEAALYHEIAAVYMSIDDRETASRYLSRDTALGPDDVSGWAARLGETYSRLQTQGKLRFGALWDSNGNQGPNSNRLTIGNFNVRFNNLMGQEAFGGWAAGDFDAAYRTSRNGSWWIVGDAHLYIRALDSDELRELDEDYSQWYRLAGGVRYATSDTMFDIRLKAEAFDYDFYNTVYSYGPELTYTYAFSRRFQLITRAGFEWREYVRNGDYDGTYWFAGEYARFVFGHAGHEFVLGGRFLRADSDTDRASYSGWEASASARFKLKGGWEISPRLSYTEERYDAPATVLETDDRRDKRWRYGLGALYRINEKWSVELDYQYTDNVSNAPLHDYDRHLVTLGLVWSF